MTRLYGLEFEGPHSIDGQFKALAGVYLIATPSGAIVDVGETENLSERIPNHERRACWNRNGGSKLWFHFEPNANARIALEKRIRVDKRPACGSR